MEELLREVLSGSRMLHFEGTKKDEAPLVEAAGRDAGMGRAGAGRTLPNTGGRRSGRPDISLVDTAAPPPFSTSRNHR